MNRARPYLVEAPRRATSVSIHEGLLADAKELQVNLSRAAERGISQAVAEKRAARWLQENKAALESSNEYVGKHGLPLGRYRQF